MADVKALLGANGFRFQKRYGQNFITDGNLLSAIAADARVEGGDTVLEVGMGAGTLTAALAAQAGRVVGCEIDETLRPILAETLAAFENVDTLFCDVLKVSDETLHGKLGGPYKLVANLPYYITTPVLFRFLYDESLRSVTVMVQKEVAQRICAAAGSAAYGALSAQMQLMGDPLTTRNVSRKLFTPQPDVDSAVVHLTIRPKCERTRLPAVRRVIAAAFAMRRKTLVNNLTAAYGLTRTQAEQAVLRVGHPADVRGERLTVTDFIALADALAGV